MNTEVLAVSISRLYDMYKAENGDREPSSKEVYDMARWAWQLNDRGTACRIVFACVHGRIAGCYEVREWFPCGEARIKPELKPVAPKGSTRYNEIERDIELNRRMAFVGQLADCDSRYKGMEAPRLYGPLGYTKKEV